MNSSLLQQKLPALLITLSIIMLPFSALSSFIVLGHAHFLMTYLYQYRGGKVNTRYLVWYIPVALFFFFLAYVLPWQAMTVIAACFFSLHFLFDESRLVRDRSYVSLMALVPPVITFLATLLYSLYTFDVRVWTFVLSIVIFIFLVYTYGMIFLRTQEVWYPNTITVLLISLYLFSIELPTMTLFGGIIIYHVLSWYFHYYIKLYPLPHIQGRYLMEVGVINALCILCFIAYDRWWITLDILKYLFESSYYYAFAMLHIVFTSYEFLALIRERSETHYRRFTQHLLP